VLQAFEASEALTIGVELELQLVNQRDFDLTRAAESLLGALAKSPRAGNVKPEITESMIEVNSDVHRGYLQLLRDLDEIREELGAAAQKLNIGVAGGGAHPFHHWAERRIFPLERFSALSELYGYLAKQFTVFGQHIHVGCDSADGAIRLTHELARFIPHFIALAASSPFAQGEDTAFASSRLHSVAAFPLSGHMPPLSSWAEFERYFARMAGFGIVRSMKDFYWDVRPKPEYGTVEIRVCDTPLDVQTAAAIAAFAQMLCAWLREQPPCADFGALYDVYDYNRFQACRFGYGARIADPLTGESASLRAQLLDTLELLAPWARQLNSSEAIELLHARAAAEANGASWMRARFGELGSLAEVVRAMCGQWSHPGPG